MKSVAVLLATVLACGMATADTVWLKNGTSVKANKTLVKGDQLVYVVGATTYRVPLSDVDHIDKSESFGYALSVVGPKTIGPAPTGGRSARTSEDGNQSGVELPGRSGVTISGAEDLLKRIVVNGHINDRALSGIESEGNVRASATAYAVAANFEYAVNKDSDQARRYLQRSLELNPNNVPLLCWYTFLLIDNGDYSEAMSRAEYAVNLEPNSPDAYYAVGSAYYAMNRLTEAVAAWKRSLSLRPNESLKRYIAKAEREVAVEENFHEKESSHFTLRFEGQKTGFALASEVSSLLERQYTEISRELGYTPQSSITVVLYTEKEFFDVTESPAWSGGLNDGKLRIPVKNLGRITPEFDRVLRHEMTHSFVHAMTHGNCPTWINEGVAQLMEPRNAAAYGPGLAMLYKEQKQISLQALEGSFMGFDETKASIAYAEALFATEFIRSGYGMGAVRRMLEQLGTGASTQSALRDATGGDYARLEQDISSILKKQFEPRQ